MYAKRAHRSFAELASLPCPSSQRPSRKLQRLFNAALAALGGSASACTTPDNTHACLIDDVLATNGSGKGKGGYNFAAVTSGANNTLYVATADPVTVGSTGQRSFCSVEDADFEIGNNDDTLC